MKTCEICCGARTIRLPVYGSVSDRVPTHKEALDAVPLQNTIRTFPCPNCADSVHEDRINVLTAVAWVRLDRAFEDDIQYLESLRHDLADQLARQLLREELIGFSTSPAPVEREFYRAKEMVATIGVVAPTAVANIQARILAGAIDIVFSVVAEARRKIMVWGSAYGHTNVGKEQACDSVNEAAREIIDQKTKQLQDLNSARMAK